MTTEGRPNNRIPGMRGVIIEAGTIAPESEGGYIGLRIKLDGLETLRDFPHNVYLLDVEIVRSADLLRLLLHDVELEAENARLREALETIGRQRLELEAPPDEVADADYCGRYDACVRTARAALKVQP